MSGYKQISTDEFIARAKKAGLPSVALSIAFRKDAQFRVKTFDYSLMAMPMSGPVPQDLENVIGMDSSCWFDDGYRLPTSDYEALEAAGLTFTRSGERKGTALERVKGFFDLLERLDKNGLEFFSMGSGVELIVLWARITLGAATDPELRAKADSELR